MRARKLGSVLVVGAALALSACGSSGGGSGASATTAATTASPGSGGATTAATVATTAGSSGSSGGTRLDLCAQTTPDLVATTYLSGIAYSGPDTYMQCVWKDTVADLGPQIKAKNFDSLHPETDAATNTYTFSGDGGSKVAIVLTKESNGKFYVTKVTLS